MEQPYNWIFLYICQDEDIDNTLLNENDLVAILQQFPFTQVFKHILHISDSGKSTSTLSGPWVRLKFSAHSAKIQACQRHNRNIFQWGGGGKVTFFLV